MLCVAGEQSNEYIKVTEKYIALCVAGEQSNVYGSVWKQRLIKVGGEEKSAAMEE